MSPDYAVHSSVHTVEMLTDVELDAIEAVCEDSFAAVVHSVGICLYLLDVPQEFLEVKEFH